MKKIIKNKTECIKDCDPSHRDSDINSFEGGEIWFFRGPRQRKNIEMEIIKINRKAGTLVLQIKNKRGEKNRE